MADEKGLTNHKDFFKAKEARECCPECSKLIIVHFRTDKQKKQFSKKDSWPDAWTFDYNHGDDTHRFLFFDSGEKQDWIHANLTFNDPSIFGGVEQEIIKDLIVPKDSHPPNEKRDPIDVLNRLLRNH